MDFTGSNPTAQDVDVNESGKYVNDSAAISPDAAAAFAQLSEAMDETSTLWTSTFDAAQQNAQSIETAEQIEEILAFAIGQAASQANISHDDGTGQDDLTFADIVFASPPRIDDSEEAAQRRTAMATDDDGDDEDYVSFEMTAECQDLLGENSQRIEQQAENEQRQDCVLTSDGIDENQCGYTRFESDHEARSSPKGEYATMCPSSDHNYSSLGGGNSFAQSFASSSAEAVPSVSSSTSDLISHIGDYASEQMNSSMAQREETVCEANIESPMETFEALHLTEDAPRPKTPPTVTEAFSDEVTAKFDITSMNVPVEHDGSSPNAPHLVEGSEEISHPEDEFSSADVRPEQEKPDSPQADVDTSGEINDTLDSGDMFVPIIPWGEGEAVSSEEGAEAMSDEEEDSPETDPEIVTERDAGFKVNWVTLRDGATDRLLWATDVDLACGDHEVRVVAKIPKEVLQLDTVHRELNFSTAESLDDFRIEQRVLFKGRCLEEWHFRLGRVEAMSSQTWTSVFHSAPECQLMPVEILNGHLFLYTWFFDGSDLLAVSKMELLYT